MDRRRRRSQTPYCAGRRRLSRRKYPTTGSSWPSETEISETCFDLSFRQILPRLRAPAVDSLTASLLSPHVVFHLR